MLPTDAAAIPVKSLRNPEPITDRPIHIHAEGDTTATAQSDSCTTCSQRTRQVDQIGARVA